MSYILDALKKADRERHLGDLPGLHSQAAAGASALRPPALWHRRSGWAWLALAGLMALLLLAFQLWPRGTLRLPPQATVLPAPDKPAPTTIPLAAEPAPAVATELPVPPPLPAPVAPVARTAKAAKVVAKPVEQKPPLSLLAELPPNLQREIPKLAIAGSIYSANPAERMLLIDKRMLHEGDEISPGLLLESVQAKSATLRYKGHDFRVVF